MSSIAMEPPFAACFTATIILSVFIIANAMAGLLPGLNVIALLGMIVGSPGMPLVGWIAHFAIGTVVWGILFALIAPRLPGAYWARGIDFSIGAWLAMMIVLMPTVGKWLFAQNAGPPVAIATLVLHLIYGVVLGSAYSLLGRNTPSSASA